MDGIALGAIGILVLIIIGMLLGLVGVLWTRERRRENDARRDKARAKAPVTKHWVKDVAWTPWSSTISEWALECKYEWTDVKGNVHSECDSWTEVY